MRHAVVILVVTILAGCFSGEVPKPALKSGNVALVDEWVSYQGQVQVFSWKYEGTQYLVFTNNSGYGKSLYVIQK